MRRLKVAIITGIFPPDAGGPATYVPRIASALVERGHSVNTITLSDQTGGELDRYSFPVHRILRPQPKWRRVPQTVRDITMLARDSDVIFCNGLWIESALAAQLSRKPLVMKIVGDWAWERSARSGQVGDTIDDFQSKRYGRRTELLKQLRTRVVQQADVVFTPSQYLSRIVARWGIEPSKLRVIYNAIEQESNGSSAELPPFAGCTVVTVGRLVPWKRIDGLIRVVAGLPNARLVVVGDGPEGEYLQELSKQLRMKERVLFVGQVPAARVASYLKAGDLFVLNSTYEGLPHIVLEAMQAGVPVVATSVGGTPEVIESGVTGLLVPPDDDESLTRALRQLLDQPIARVRLAEAGRQRVAEHFSWQGLVDETERLLVSVVRTQ